MKRYFSLLLCILLTFSLITGCSTPEQTKQLLQDIADIAATYEATEETKEAGVTETGETAEEANADAAAEAGNAQAEAAAETPQEGKYPIEWDLSEFFKNEEEWDAAYQKASKLIDEIKTFRGTLNTANGIRDFVAFTYDGELAQLLAKMDWYASSEVMIDSVNEAGLKHSAQVSALITKKQQEEAFVDEEIYQLDLEERKKIFSDPVLADYAYSLRAYTDETTVHHSEETEKALSEYTAISDSAYSIYLKLANVDRTVPSITMPDGTERKLTKTLYANILYGNYDRKFKAEASQLIYQSYSSLGNSFAATLNTHVATKVAEARIAGYDSTLEYALKQSDVDPVIYEKIKATVHEMTPAMKRYLETRKKELGVDKLYTFEISASGDYNPEISFDDAFDQMLDVLSVLGEDYSETAASIAKESHIDVYERQGKDSGACSCSNGIKTIDPYILFNYTGRFNYVDTLYHEMGHTMYSYYSINNPDLNLTNNEPGIFTQEVTSCNNEFLFMQHGLKNAKTNEEKKAFLYMPIQMIWGTILTQMMYSEFEEYAYEVVENGGVLTADDLCSKWMELYRSYYGEEIEAVPGFEYYWIAIPHFYYTFYVYQYATACTYAAATASKITNQEDGAVENYRKFLTLGASDKPSVLLKAAGIDPLKDETYAYVVNMFSQAVDQYAAFITRK